MLLGVRYNERENNKIVTLGPNKVSVRPSVVAGVYFSQTSVTFAGDCAAVCNSEVSARQEFTQVYIYILSIGNSGNTGRLTIEFL